MPLFFHTWPRDGELYVLSAGPGLKPTESIGAECKDLDGTGEKIIITVMFEDAATEALYIGTEEHEAVAAVGRWMLGGMNVAQWNEATGGGAMCPLSWMDERLPSPCPLCGATRESDTHTELYAGPAPLEPRTPEDLGFEWQADACNWVLDEPADLGRAYIESAHAGSWGARPEMTAGPVRVSFVVVGSDLGDGEEHEAEIARLRFATVAGALKAWEE